MRSSALVLVGLSGFGLLLLAISPLVAVLFAGALVIGGVAVGARGDRSTGLGLAATGGALFLAAVLVLALTDARQDRPVILGPDTGLTPGG